VPEIEGYWEQGSTFPNFLYRCADGELIQVWFGGKGMYSKLIDVLGDEPSAAGYYSDQMTGKLGVRAARWTSFFATRTRADWIRLLRAAGVACEPVLAPGELLADPYLAATGLAAAVKARSCSGRPSLLSGPALLPGAIAIAIAREVMAAMPLLGPGSPGVGVHISLDVSYPVGGGVILGDTGRGDQYRGIAE
jgi:crotonobetainyl-CoA:carnitine CoA-transferase CaiB-like acyl-CoA transferase